MSKKHTFCVHDDSINTYGFRMLTEGANLDEFNKNPVILYNHDDWDMPIGRGENARKENGKILVDIVFDDADGKRGAEVAGKVERGFIRAASVGAWPPEEMSDDDSMKLPGQSGPTITKWTMREASICPIGSNHNALAMYDHKGNRIDLNDKSALVKLMDNVSTSINHKMKSNMSFLTQMLKLSDSASDQAIQEAVQGLIALRDNLQTENATLKTENQTLRGKVSSFESAKKDADKQEAIALVDAAIKDGRIDAKGKDSWIEDFETDFAKAKVRLSSISPRQSISRQIKTDSGKQPGNIQLADMSFAEIREKDLIKELKKEPELYREKFYETYGKYPE